MRASRVSGGRAPRVLPPLTREARQGKVSFLAARSLYGLLEAGIAEIEIGGVEIVHVDDLAEETGVEGFTRERVEENAGDVGGERWGHGPGGEVGTQNAGGEKGHERWRA